MDLNPVGIRVLKFTPVAGRLFRFAQYICMDAWKPQNNPEGAMHELSEALCRIEKLEKDALPNLHEGQTLIVLSDYSGRHKGVDFESMSFLLADLERCKDWEARRKIWRRKFLPDGRRMAFKSLADGMKARALEEFLQLADSIQGLSITILVHKNIRSLFADEKGIDWESPELAPYRHWRKGTFERMLRIVHFVSFFISGFSRPGQNILWITDEDEIAANEARLRELTRILGNVSSHYLSHDMGHLRCGTTKSDKGSRCVEDLAAIPDLVAGMLAEAVSEQRRQNLIVSGGIITPPARGLQQKVISLLNWFATNRQPLKRLVFFIELTADGFPFLRRLKFHGSNDVPD